jgi:conjugal transfer pilus assembly protein TrbC
MRTLFIWSCLLATGTLPALAQAPAVPLMPSSQDIERRMRDMASPSDAGGPRRLPSAQDLQRAAPSMPQLDALPAVPPSPASATPATADLFELASRYERMRVGEQPAGLPSPQDALPGLMVFVSLGMPVASLERLVDDAQRTGAVLVLRGVQNRSLKTTKATIQQLIGQRRVAWRIDPPLFKALRIEAVPTYVLMDPNQAAPLPCGAPGQEDGTGQCGQPFHTRVAGDVSIGRALLAMAETGPAAAAMASSYLRRLRGSQP